MVQVRGRDDHVGHQAVHGAVGLLHLGADCPWSAPPDAGLDRLEARRVPSRGGADVHGPVVLLEEDPVAGVQTPQVQLLGGRGAQQAEEGVAPAWT